MHRMLLYNVDMNIYKSSSVFQIDFFFISSYPGVWNQTEIEGSLLISHFPKLLFKEMHDISNLNINTRNATRCKNRDDLFHLDDLFHSDNFNIFVGLNIALPKILMVLLQRK